MTYVSWSVLYEGSTDSSYFDVLIPRLMEELVLADGVGHVTVPAAPSIRLGTRGRSVDEVAAEVCASIDAFYLVFIHADVGGRALAERLPQRSEAYCEAFEARCNFPRTRCVVVAPRHETEAWVLIDAGAVAGVLGFSNVESLGLPRTTAEAERLTDPKATLLNVVSRVRGRRSQVLPEQIFPAIAQRQDILMLRRSASFQAFESRLREALISLGCIRRRRPNNRRRRQQQ